MSGEGNGAHSKGLATERKGMRRRVPDTEPNTARCQDRPYNDMAYALFVSSVEEPDVGNPQVRFCEGR